MTRTRFIVRGRVQGVFFRAEAVREATARGLTGRVWNRADGAVELIVEGRPEAVVALGDWLGRGPRLAQVERVERMDLVGDARYSEFSIVHSAPE
jgi:acylphosphatase